VTPLPSRSVREDPSCGVNRLEGHLRRLVPQPEDVGDPQPKLIPLITVQHLP
jgi:hypothetical protein